MIEAISHLIHRDYEAIGAHCTLISPVLQQSTLHALPSSHICTCLVQFGPAPHALPHLAVEDFVTLQFIPPGTDLKPILPALANVFDQVGIGC